MLGVERMLEDIRSEVRLTRGLIGREQLSARVMEAMASVPRERFVPSSLRAQAYANGPLPIGHGQTISQPYIVALMTDLAELTSSARVLEVGTGCGYQTAILAELAAEVFTIEIIPELARIAAERFTTLGYRNIHARQVDGNRGWPEEAPYDAIVVTAAAPEVPPALIEQLAAGGRLVIPVGRLEFGQSLQLLRKDDAGRVTTQDILPVAFVPLTGQH